MKALINGKLILPQEIITGQTLLFEDRICGFQNAGQPLPPDTEIIDARGSFVSPGFINLHIHGCGGADTMDATPEALATMCRRLPESGVTSFLPTTMTRPWPLIQKALDNIRSLRAEPPAGARILGAHLEGPFISEAYRGSQKVSDIQRADFAKIRPYAGLIKIIVVAPECLPEDTFISACRKAGIIVALGHSGATYEDAVKAIQAGASHITHTFNAMSPLHHRKPGIVGAALTQPVITEIISDGFHIHEAVLALLAKVKGPDRIVVVTDSMRAAMQGDGISELGGQTVYVKNGRALLADGTIAASIDVMNHSLKHFYEVSGFTLPEVIRTATMNPARELGLEDEIGSLKEGARADLALFDSGFAIRATYVDGEKVFGL
jgi:N-acetylglucosamine-6-phosphate deacetylase